MKHQGFTLLELLITLAVIAITLTIGIPSFNKTIQNNRTKTATLSLLDAIETTRATAVFRNKRVVLIATDTKWHHGWTLFVDNNNNGTLESDDETLLFNEKLIGVVSTSRSPMNAYVSFVGTGEGRQVSNNGDGGFLAGTIKICPEKEGDGYSLVLSKGGRTRIGKLSVIECDAIR